MPISLNNVSSIAAAAAYAVANPALPWGTAMEEVPCSLGRSWEGYKRGGILEGSEKLRKEFMTAAVWIAGIPFFNSLGNLFCEKILNLPMHIDFSDTKNGNDAIGDTIRYLKTKENPKNLDLSTLGKMKDIKIKGTVEDTIRHVKTAKTISTVSAVILNCIMMGIVIPKFNQKLTDKKLKEMESAKVRENTLKKPVSMDEFMNKSKKTPSFKGNLMNTPIAYTVENNSRFRLVVTDIPMIIGRMITSRNKYEALEYLVIDAGSTYFYNFSAEHIQKLARGITSTPAANPKVAQTLSALDYDTIKNAIDTLVNNPDIAKREGEKGGLERLFGDKTVTVENPRKLFSRAPKTTSCKKLSEALYDYATFGKFGKINKFVAWDDIDGIDSQTSKFIKSVAQKAGYLNFDKSTKKWSFTGKDFNFDEFVRLAKKYNTNNAIFMGIGLLISIYGLARFMPRLAYKITEHLTGKNTFTGIEHYDDEPKKRSAA